MLSVEEAVKRGPLLIALAIKQREKDRDAKRKLISSFRASGHERQVERARERLREAQENLEYWVRLQEALPDTINRMDRRCNKLTQEIAELRLHQPRDKSGKLAKLIAEAGLTREQTLELFELLGEIKSYGNTES